jgi:hypothetical protein
VTLFKPLNKIRGAILFQEGEPANYVYIITSGEFCVQKKVLREKEKYDKNTDAIYMDPLKVKR